MLFRIDAGTFIVTGLPQATAPATPATINATPGAVVAELLERAGCGVDFIWRDAGALIIDMDDGNAVSARETDVRAAEGGL
ncbi:MAG: hypothetical protein AAFW98_06465 [Pseudomonadota bacterium]